MPQVDEGDNERILRTESVIQGSLYTVVTYLAADKSDANTERIKKVNKMANPINEGNQVGEIEGYQMVPSSLKVLAKFGLCSNCSPKIR